MSEATTMTFLQWTQASVGLSLAFSVLAFVWRLRAYRQLARPADKASPKGAPLAGILYAYTLGMAPWAKESTRRHRLPYLRGVIFHIGIFLGLAFLLASPWVSAFPAIIRNGVAAAMLVGALCGLIGFAARFFERNLKALSTPDDYFAVLWVSLCLASAALAALFPTWLPLFYLMTATLLVYAPFSKIRHCLYFASSRFFYGRFMGSRAILPHRRQHWRAGQVSHD
jgi:nitrate reductase gamma subunit